MNNMITTTIALILLCTTTAAAHHTNNETGHFIIAPLVWAESGNLESDVQMTFIFNNQSFTQHTESDGSCCFDCANFDGIGEGDEVDVICKYGLKTATINHQEWGQGVTFNEPSSKVAIAAFAAMGLIATAIGGGIYWLRKKLS